MNAEPMESAVPPTTTHITAALPNHATSAMASPTAARAPRGSSAFSSSLWAWLCRSLRSLSARGRA